MPRPARRILTCVLIGLLLNAGVTAACWLAQPEMFLRQSNRTRVYNTSAGQVARSVSRNDYLLHGIHWSARGRPTDLETPPPPNGDSAVATSGFRYQFGFPFRSLQFRDSLAEHYEYGTDFPAFTHSVNSTHTLPLHQRGLPTGLTPARYRLIPIDPVLPGFLLNTLLYAALPAAVMTASHLRTSRRRRQSRCPACGYPLTGLSTCPECGNTPPVARLAEPGPYPSATTVPPVSPRPPVHAHDEPAGPVPRSTRPNGAKACSNG